MDEESEFGNNTNVPFESCASVPVVAISEKQFILAR